MDVVLRLLGLAFSFIGFREGVCVTCAISRCVRLWGVSRVRATSSAVVVLFLSP